MHKPPNDSSLFRRVLTATMGVYVLVAGLLVFVEAPPPKVDHQDIRIAKLLISEEELARQRLEAEKKKAEEAAKRKAELAKQKREEATAEAERLKKLEADKKRREEAARKKAEEIKKKAEEAARKKAEAAKAEAERLKKLERERLKKLEEERLKKLDDKARKKAEAERKEREAEAARRKAEEDQRKAAEQAQRLAEEKRKADAEAKRLAEEKRKADAEAQRLAEKKRKAEAAAQRIAEQKRQAEAARQATIRAERQRKERIALQEAARQAEIARRAEAARQAEVARLAAIEAERKAEAARLAAIRRQAEIDRIRAFYQEQKRRAEELRKNQEAAMSAGLMGGPDDAEEFDDLFLDDDDAPLVEASDGNLLGGTEAATERADAGGSGSDAVELARIEEMIANIEELEGFDTLLSGDNGPDNGQAYGEAASAEEMATFLDDVAAGRINAGEMVARATTKVENPFKILGEIGGTGIRSADTITRIIRAHRGELTHFYDKALVRIPGLTGTVTVRMVIAADGTIKSASVDHSTTNAPGFDAALIARIKDWTFPPVPTGDVEGLYPFRFSEDF